MHFVYQERTTGREDLRRVADALSFTIFRSRSSELVNGRGLLLEQSTMVPVSS